MLRCLIFLAAFAFLTPAARAGEPLLRKGDRVLCLGDSITQDGRYLVALDLILRSRMPETPVEIIPLGLSSETLSGTSERQHPWPRPDVHERAARAMEQVKPTVLMFCYGMNDGIYAPPDAGRMAQYRTGNGDLVNLARTAGARVVILTPPPFDAASFRGKLAPDGAEDYGFQQPWEKYNQTLGAYASWLRDTPGLADRVMDFHTPLTAVIAAWHRQDPAWSSGDGIHPVAAIHWLMAGLIAEGLGVPGAVADLMVKPDAQGAWNAVFQASPPVATPEGVPPGLFNLGGFQKLANRFELTVANAPTAAMRLMSGGQLLGVLTRGQLARGVDLTAFPALSLNRDAAAALPLAMERYRILAPAWREHVGHTRPDTDRTALPLAEAQAAVAKIDAQLSTLLKPRQESLTLEPVNP